ncbi:MAG: hypothetical protein HC836_46130 [Richelia sp. RM2_1_2]|nr:hypothetical protein [Richelia sp. RM2_1_2]
MTALTGRKPGLSYNELLKLANSGITSSLQRVQDGDGANTPISISTTAVSLNSTKISDVADPTLAQDAATKAYVDGLTSSKYVAINSTGTAASATGTDAIAIGEGASAIQINSVAIGPAVSNGASNTVKIGSSNTNYMSINSNADFTLYDGAGGTTTSISVDGSSANIDLTLVPKGTGRVVVSNRRVTSVEDPISAQDAATKNYVDTTTQPLDSDLTAIANLTTTGIIVRTGTGTATTRTITGTGNNIVVTNGDGVSGSPTLDIGTDVVTLTDTQTLTNKTFTDNVTFFQDQTDATKKLQFELSGITTATIRTLTIPNASGTIALTTDTTLTYFKANSTGTAASATGTDAIAIGEGASANQTNSVAIGPAVANTSADTVKIGSSNTNYMNLSNRADLTLYDGAGGTDTFIAVDGSAANIALTLAPKGTGNVRVSSKKIENLADPTAAQDAATKNYVDTTTTANPIYVAVAGDTMTGLLTLSGDPSSNLHAATKQYVDSVAAGLDPKASCRVATTANITLSGTQTIDGIGVIAGNRVLVKNQLTTTQNGIYVVASGAWTRATDFDGTPSNEVSGGAFTFIEEGSTLADTGWVVSSDGVLTIGSSAINWTQFSGAGNITASNIGTGEGVFKQKTGNNLEFKSIIASTNITITNNTDDLTISAPDVATLTGTETLTNKTFTDATTFFQDNLITTKKMQFQLSSITAGTTRTLTVPNASGTIALTDDLLDYQPLDSDLTAVAGLSTTGIMVRTGTGTATTRTITGTTNRITVTNGTGVSGNPTLDIGTDVVTLTGTQTLTNKTFTDNVTFFQDNTDATKKLQFELSGITTATTRTLTVPNASGTIALTSDTTLTYFKANSTGTAASATGTDAIAIGEGASATQTNSVAIGPAVANTTTNTLRIGTSSTNYLNLSATGDLTFGSAGASIAVDNININGNTISTTNTMEISH